MADLFGPPPLDEWPEPLRFLYEERWRIRFWEAGMDEEAAKAAALLVPQSNNYCGNCGTRLKWPND